MRYGRLDYERSGGADNPLNTSNQASTNTENFYALSPVFTVTRRSRASTDVSVTSRPADGTDTFKHGERVEVTVTFRRGGGGAECAGTGGGNV